MQLRILDLEFSCLHLLSTEITCMSHYPWIYVVLGIKARALCVLGKDSTNGATLPKPDEP